MNKNSQYSVVTHDDNKLYEIKNLLSKFFGDKITFNQFTGIMDKDNTLRFYNRDSLLHRRRKFFKEEPKRGRESRKEIHMPLDRFADFLKILVDDRRIKLNLETFKRAVIYSMDIGYVDKK